MKLKRGDIFEFSINDNTTCYGQIIDTSKKNAITVIIFEGLYKSRPEISELLKDKILFFGNTFDAKFYHNHWIVFNNSTTNIKEIKLPYYKIGIEPIFIEDFFENKLRIIKNYEENILFYRSYVAPVRFESALKAYYKILNWDDSYNELLYSNLLKGIKLVEDE